MKRQTTRYADACGTAHTLDLLGDRWALLVARELLLGPRRFSQLQAALPGINPKVLSQRLTELEARAVLFQRKLPPPASVKVYELTEWGYELEPITAAMGRWAARSPLREPGLSISGVSLLLSFRAMLDPKRAESIDAKIGFQFGDDAYVACISNGAINVEPGDCSDADVRFSGSPDTLAMTIYGQQPLAEAEANGFHVGGDRSLAQRFVGLFPLPPTAPIKSSKSATV